jgi:eukaryotic-like serine/threonine-protein kinase
MSALRRLITEVHRRSLWQVVGIYCLGSWAAYQVIAELTDRVGMPDWVPGFAIVLFLVGLPVVVATAFVQEGLPGRARRRRRRPRGRAAAAADPARAVTDPSAAPGDPVLTAADPTMAAAPAQRRPVDGPHAERVAPRRPADGEHPWLLTWRRSILAGIVAFLLLGLTAGGYMGLRNAGIGPFGSLVGAGVLDARDRLLVAEFDSRTADDGLGRVVTEAFRVDFAQSPILTLLDPSFVREALRRMERDPATALAPELARELAVREGIKAFVTGEVASAGGGFLISARLVATADGTVLASFRETAADSTGLLAAIDRLSKKMRERIGESLRTIRANAPLEQVTTPSLEALRRYSQAEAALDLERDYDRALTLLEEAVSLDPGFAMAWRKIGVVLSNQRRDRARTVDALARAYEHRDRLTEREGLLATGTYFDLALNDAPRAIQAYRTLLETWPQDRAALNNIGTLYTAIGDRENAVLYYERTIEADPHSAVTYNNLVLSYFVLGRPEQARRVHALMAERFPGNPSVTNQAALFAYDAGDVERAESLVRERRAAFRGSPSVQAETSNQLGSLALLRGQVADAAAHFRDILTITEERSPGARLGWEIGAASADLRVLGTPGSQVLRDVEAELSRGTLATLQPVDRPYIRLARLYAEAGRPERARELLAEYEREVPADLRRGESAAPAEGAIALAEERYDDAVAAFHRWRRDMPACVPCGLPELALAWELIGRADSAIAYYQRYIESPFLGRIGSDAVELPPTLERLGALHEAQGDIARAAEYYGRFVELWRNADGVLQPRVQAAVERLRRLSADGGR